MPSTHIITGATASSSSVQRLVRGVSDDGDEVGLLNSGLLETLDMTVSPRFYWIQWLLQLWNLQFYVSFVQVTYRKCTMQTSSVSDTCTLHLQNLLNKQSGGDTKIYGVNLILSILVHYTPFQNLIWQYIYDHILSSAGLDSSIFCYTKIMWKGKT